jgi:hypothetical protein
VKLQLAFVAATRKWEDAVGRDRRTIRIGARSTCAQLDVNKRRSMPAADRRGTKTRGSDKPKGNLEGILRNEVTKKSDLGLRKEERKFV